MTMADGAERILFISLSCVGDAVMTTPVLQALHQLYPQALIDIVADRRSSDLFLCCPYRGEIVHKDKHKAFRGVVSLLKELRARKYDVIIDLRTDGVAYLLRGKKRYTKWRAQPYGTHSVEQLMGVIRRIYGDRPIPAANVWLAEAHYKFAEKSLSVLPGKQWLALAPGVGGAEEKLWPVDKYATLANSLTDLFSGVILVGSVNERQFTAAVSRNLTVPFVDMAGNTDLLQVAALIKCARMFVGSDSGLGHVASAVSVPSLTFFSVDTPERCRPWGNKGVWLTGENQDARGITIHHAEAKIRQCLQAAQV
ncbi:MAG: glycosyltransferase family 9 protein [Proteobacteria bacterium]|nr:glycosyltransferase family 9 protein [Pseudomonadota bacterium]